MEGMDYRYFQQALSDFTFDAACGGAIRHLAGLGYTAREIRERLSFPVPFERVRQAYTRYLLEERILCRGEPGRQAEQERYAYVQEEGKYGRKSFRRVKVEADAAAQEAPAYISCEFAFYAQREGFRGLKLTAKQREYLAGICWEKNMYHVRDARMDGIIRGLSEAGQLPGAPRVII